MINKAPLLTWQEVETKSGIEEEDTTPVQNRIIQRDADHLHYLNNTVKILAYFEEIDDSLDESIKGVQTYRSMMRTIIKETKAEFKGESK